VLQLLAIVPLFLVAAPSQARNAAGDIGKVSAGQDTRFARRFVVLCAVRAVSSALRPAI
jgi:hypothetical protein